MQDLPERSDPAETARLFPELRRALLEEIREHPLYDGLRQWYDRDDVLQELWQRVFGSGAWDRFEDRGPGSLRAFLLRAVDCLMVDLQRRCPGQEREGGSAESAGVCPGPGSALVLGDWLAACEAVLAGDEKLAWQLRTRDGLGIDGIGRQLRKSDPEARDLMLRALCRLRERGLLDG